MRFTSVLSAALVACLVGVTVAGCGGGGGGGGGGGDTTAPAVVSVAPAAHATDAEPIGAITVTFSEPMDCNTVTATTFLLADAGGYAVGGTVACSGTSASFTPTTQLTYGAQYTATVTRDVKNSSGITLAAAHRWDFNTRMRRWTAAALVETADGEVASPQVALAENGNAVAVWLQANGARNDVWANSYTPAAGWGTPVLIETDDRGTVRELAVASDPASGKAAAVWAQSDGARFNILLSRYTPGAGWAVPQLAEYNDTDAAVPQAGLDGSGDVVIVWSQHNGTNWSIWGNHQKSGVWGVAANIESDATGDADSPQVAIDASGNAVAVWTRNNGANTNIWANRYTKSAGWGTAALAEGASGRAAKPMVAVDQAGDALVVWQHFNGTSQTVMANRNAASDGVWGIAASIENSGGDSSSPVVAVNAAGGGFALWLQSDASGATFVMQNAYIAGVGWNASTVAVDGNAVRRPQAPQLAASTGGDMFAVWPRYDGTNHLAMARRYDGTAGGWLTAGAIHTQDAPVTSPQVRAAGGSAVAVWLHSDGVRSSLWASSFD